jgi:uncharacterized membrane protein
MPLALTGQEWALLVVAIGPVVIAVLVVYFVWRWAKRDEAREKAERGD